MEDEILNKTARIPQGLSNAPIESEAIPTNSKLVLSVVIPVFNEKDYLEQVVGAVLEQRIPGIKRLEVIVVDDCSSDGTADKLRALRRRHPETIKPFFHSRNQGKGSALRTGFGGVTGDIVVIQDADLEYDPGEYGNLIKPIMDGRADVVYGSRFIGSQEKRVLFFWHMIGNRVLTLLSNMFTNLNLTDMETGHKAFARNVIHQIKIQEDRFGCEPEITAKVAKGRFRIYEVGIPYFGRTYDEGKKIDWRDGVWALWCIIKYNLFLNK